MSHAPRGWTSAALGDVTLKPAKLDPVSTGRRAVRYVDIGLLDGPVDNLREAPEIVASSAPSRCRQLLAAGDTLYSTVRPYLRKIAHVGADLDQEFASTGFSVLRAGPAIEKPYLYYFCLSPQFEDQILPFQRGVSYPSVLDREVRAQSVWYPDLPEQRRIVEILEDHLSRLHSAEAYASAAQQRASALVASTASALVERAQPADAQPLGTYAISVTYGTSAKAHEAGSETDIPVLRMGNIRDGRLDWTSLKYIPPSHPDVVKASLKPGDLLFNRTNSAELVGKSAVYHGERPATLASYLIRVRFDERVRPDWANLVINSAYGRRYITSVVSQQVGQANVNGKKLKAFPLPVPSISDQAAYLGEFFSAVDAADDVDRTCRRTLTRCASLRRAVLAAAFNGELTGRSTDDELIAELVKAGV